MRFMIFKIMFRMVLLTEHMFAVIHELLAHSDKEYYTEYEPDGKKNNNENNL